MTAIRERGESTTVFPVTDRLVADLAREAYTQLLHNSEFVTSADGFQSAVTQRVQRYQLG